MHEWGITESVIKEIIRQADENTLNKIDKVCLSIGEDSDITPDSLDLCFKSLANGTVLEKVKLELNKCPGSGIVIKTIEGEK